MKTTHKYNWTVVFSELVLRALKFVRTYWRSDSVPCMAGVIYLSVASLRFYYYYYYYYYYKFYNNRMNK